MSDKAVGMLPVSAVADELQQRTARLLNLFSIYIVFTAVLGGAIRFFAGGARIPFFVAGLAVLAVGVAQLFLRQGEVRRAGIVLTTAVWLALVVGLFFNGGVYAPVFSLMIGVVVIAGLLVGRRAALVFAFLSTAVGLVVALGMSNNWFVVASVAHPLVVWVIISLAGFLGTAVLLYLGVGDLHEAVAHLQQNNEALSDTRTLLEIHAAERSSDLSLAAQIGRLFSQARDLEELLFTTVKLICEHYDLYHVQIYLLDSTARTLRLHASTGSAGTELLRQGHRLPLGAGSVNGTAAAQKKTIIISDTRTSRLFRANPFLPKTQSEIAVPLLIGSQLVGVLDLQSQRLVDPVIEKIDLFELLAGQLAIAVQNAQLFTRTADTQQEQVATTKQTIYEGWSRYLDAIEREEYQGFEYENGQLHQLRQPLDLYGGEGLALPLTLSTQQIGVIQLEKPDYEAWERHDFELIDAVSRQLVDRLENIRLLADAERFRIQAEQANQRLVHEAWQTYQQRAGHLGYAYNQIEVFPLTAEATLPASKTAVSSPIMVQGTRIGYLEVGAGELVSPADEADDMSELVAVIATQLSTHIENLRLTQQTEVALAESQARAKDLAFVNRVVSKISASLDLDASLQFIVDQIVEMLGIDQARIALLNDAGTGLTVVAERYDPAKSPSALGVEIPLPNSPATAIVLNKRETVVVDDPKTSLLTQSVHSLMAEQGIETLAIIPLVVGNQVLGTVGLDILEKGKAFTPEQIRLAETVVFQAAAALQSSRSFKQTERALATTEALYEGSDRIIKAEWVEDVLVALLQSPSLLRVAKAELIFFEEAQLEDALPEMVTTAVSWQQTAANDWRSGLDNIPQRLNVADYPAYHLLGSRTAPTFIKDLALDERFDAQARASLTGDLDLHGLMALPLLSGELWIGMFVGLTREPLQLTDDAQRQLTALVGQAAIVLQNKRLLANTERALQQTEQQAWRLAMLNELSGLLSTAGTLEDALVGTLQYTERIFDEVRLSVALLTEEATAFQLATLRPDEQLISLGTAYPLAGTAVAEVISTDQLMSIGDMQHTHFSEIRPLRQQGIRSVLMTPMKTPSGVLGVLTVGSQQPNVFSESDKSIVTQIGSLLAATIENRRLLAEARRQADRERIVNNINQKIQGTATMEMAMRTAIQELGQALRARHTQIRLNRANGAEE